MSALATTPSLLPPSSTPLERAIEQTQARFDPPLRIPGLWNSDTCPASFLPYLAWVAFATAATNVVGSFTDGNGTGGTDR